jgi:hypothetical protein
MAGSLPDAVAGMLDPALLLVKKMALLVGAPTAQDRSGIG